MDGRKATDERFYELELHFGVPADMEEPGAPTAKDLVELATSRLEIAERLRGSDVDHFGLDELLGDVQVLQFAAIEALNEGRVRISYSTSLDERTYAHVRVWWVLCEAVARGEQGMVSERIVDDFMGAIVGSLEGFREGRSQAA